MSAARSAHAATAVVATGALVLQLVLVIDGASVLDVGAEPGLGLRVARFAAYFTIQSNVLVAISTAMLVIAPHRDGTAFRALRLAGIVGITVTGLVHFFLLRPLLELDGASWAADKLLHMVVPVLAVVGWAAVGPRPRINGPAIAVAFAWPMAWLGGTLSIAGLTRWVPYPFLDFRAEGWGHVGVVCIGITVLFAALIWTFRYADQSLGASSARLSRRVRPTHR